MRIKLIVCVAVLLVIGLVVDLVFIGKVTTRSLPAHWSITGETPWGTIEHGGATGAPVVLWSPVRGGFCYDAVFSRDLRERLATL